MTIEHYISNLLKTNECVVVPGFGGFIKQNQTAQLRNDSLVPPHSNIAFNAQLKQSNSILLDHIVVSEQISYAQANDKIQSFVNEVTQSLIDYQSYKLPAIGKLFFTAEGELKFVQNTSDNFHSNSFGLPTLQVSKIERKEKELAVVKDYIKEKQRTNPWALAFTAVASVILLLFAGSLYLLNQGTEREQDLIRNQFSLFNTSFTSTSSHKDVPTDDENSFEVEHINQSQNQATTHHSAELNEPVKDSENNHSNYHNENKQLETLNSTNPPSTEEIKETFHVVIGVFEVQKFANRTHEKAQELGYNSELIKGRKYYRVVVPFDKETTSWRKAVDEMQDAIAPGAWVWESRNL